MTRNENGQNDEKQMGSCYIHDANNKDTDDLNKVLFGLQFGGEISRWLVRTHFI